MILLTNNYVIFKDPTIKELESLYLHSDYKFSFVEPEELSADNRHIYLNFSVIFKDKSEGSILSNTTEKIFEGKVLDISINTCSLGGIWVEVIGTTDGKYKKTYFFSINVKDIHTAYLVGNDAEL